MVFAFLVCSTVVKNNAYAQTLPQAVEMALSNSPSIKAEMLRAESYNEQRNLALSLRRPSVQLEASTGISEYGTKSQNFFGQTQSVWRGLQPSSISIVASQPLYTSGRVATALELSQLQYLQAIERVRSIQFQVAQKAIDAYSNVLKDNAILNINIEGVDNLNAQLKGALALQKAGLVGKTDVAQAQTRLAKAQGQTALARAKYNSSLITLSRITGSSWESVGQDSVVIFLPPNLDFAIEQAISNNSEIKISKYDELISKTNIKAIKSEYKPRVTLNATSATNFNSVNPNTRVSDNQISARLTIPLWSGGQEKSRILSARYNSEASRLDTLELKDKIIEELKISWEAIEAAKEGVRLANEEVKAAQIAKKGAELELKAGTRTILDVLNQEEEVLNAKIDLSNAHYQLLINSINLMFLIGADPTEVLNPTTEFNPLNIKNNPNAMKVGIPTIWEKPLVYIHDNIVLPNKTSPKQVKKIINNKGFIQKK